MKSILYILPVLVLLLLTSCYKEINLDEYRTPPKIVINCAAFTNAPVTASVTRTWFYTENTPYVKLPNAKVELYVNGDFKEQMKWQPLTKEDKSENIPDSVFASGYIPKEGDKIKIVASNSGYQTVYAEDVVPHEIPIINLEHTERKVTINSQGYYYENGQMIEDKDYVEVTYKITFQDIPDEDNYYMIQVNAPWNGDNYMYVDLSYIDPILKDQDTVIDGALGFDGINNRNGCLFTDRDIKGKEYTLRVKELFSTHFSNSAKRRVILYSISEAYYQYLLSLQKVSGSTVDGGMGNIGFAEPIRVYSNVEGGAGILGTSQYDSRDIEIVVE